MTRPNIVVIYCDDLGYGDLSCYGSDSVQSPHLDKLAATGVRFTDWYSNAPVCSPSRASLLTGLYPARAGITQILGGKRGMDGLPQEKVTIAKMLKHHGYRTALFGKWHLGMSANTSPNAHGFEEFYGFKAGCIDYFSHIFYWGQGNGINPVHDLWGNEEEVWANGQYMTDLITTYAVDYIERSNASTEPFLIYAAYNAPHYPMHAPEKYMERFKHLPWDRQVMAAMIAAVDDGVGQIIDALRRKGQYENTIIFFSSDNGPSAESRNWLDGTEDLYYGGSAGIFRGHKFSLFEGGIREPAILSWPGTIPGERVCEEVAMMMDVMPTLLDLIAIDPSSGPLSGQTLDGRSLKKLLLNGEATPHQQLFWESGGQLAVREDNLKLVLQAGYDTEHPDEKVWLSDLRSDPGERINLAHQQPETVLRLTKAVNDWYAQIIEGT